MNRRQRIGYALTLISLTILLGGFMLSPIFAAKDSSLSSILTGMIITILPIAVLAPRAIKRELRAYQNLALLAPIYLFYGGIIWLWRSPLWGALFCSAAITLEIGTILHNYQKRQKKKN